MLRYIPACLFCLSLNARAQTPTELIDPLRAVFPEENSVFSERKTMIEVDKEGEGFVIRRTVVEDMVVLSDASSSPREREVPYSGFIELKEIEASTLVPSGKSYKKVRVDRIHHRDERDGQTFHDDQRVAFFTFPALGPGAVGHLRYVLQTKEPRFAGGFFFEGFLPTLESSLTVSCGPGVTVDPRRFNMPDSTFEHTRSKERGRMVDRFTMRHVPAMRYEEDAPSPRYYSPHVQLVVNSSERDVDELYSWYASFTENCLKPASPAIQQLADSITAGLDGTEDKAGAIFRWLQGHVRYVAFEDGLNGLQPAVPDDVLRLRYADCKGMSSLLRALLVAAGLEAHLAWIGSREIPYTFDTLPTSNVSDHMIVAMEHPKGTWFLDATSALIRPGTPSGFIQGKEAMIGLGERGYRREVVPIVPAAVNQVVDSVTAWFEGTDLTGTGVARYTGYERVHLVDWHRSTRPEKRNELMRYVLMKNSNAFLLDEYTIEGIELADTVAVIRYRFRIPNSLTRSGQRAFFPGCLADPWKSYRVSEQRRLPLEFDHRSEQRFHLEVRIPEGMVCVTAPPGVFEGMPEAQAAISATCDGRFIRSDATFTQNSLLIDTHLQEFLALNKRVYKNINSSFVFETE